MSDEASDPADAGPTQAERDRAIFEKLVVEGDSDPFIFRSRGDPSFPLETESLVALKLMSEENPAAFDRLWRRLKKDAPEVHLKALERAIRKAGAKAGGAANNDSEFSMTHTGLYHRKGLAFEWISQPFEVLALARSPAVEDWSQVVRFCAYGERTCQTVVDNAVLHSDPKTAIEMLVRQGLKIKNTAAAHQAFVEYLAEVETTERATIANRTGWIEIDGKRAFVLPDEVIGAELEEAVILTQGVVGLYERGGTLAGWQKGVGGLVADHCLPRFAVAIGFAGTLLEPGGFESGAFHFYGQSSEGKTTCVRCGASVWGSGADGGYMRTWRATSNGLEGNLAAAFDTLLPIDEVGQTDGKEVGLALYMATSGRGKARMRRDATLRKSYTWRVLMLSSGELPIESKLNEDLRRARAHAGHLVRAIDIDARREFGAFDRPYPDFDPIAFADELKRAALTHYGAAGPEFVRQLIERGITGETVRRRVAAFVDDALKGAEAVHGQAARAAERFGLVAVAGELAIEFGVVPWEEGQPTADAQELLQAWLKERGGATAYEARQIVAQVRHFLAAHGDARFDDLDPPPVSVTGQELERRPVLNRAGWRKGAGDDRRWYVPPEVFRREVCAGFNLTEAARVLAKMGALDKAADGKSAQVVRLPGMKPQRLYVLTPAIFEGEEA
jgi:putative DNA primase/helicase